MGGNGTAVGEDPGYIEFKSISSNQNKLYISSDTNKPYYFVFNFRKNDNSNFTEDEREKLDNGIKNGNLRLINLIF